MTFQPGFRGRALAFPQLIGSNKAGGAARATSVTVTLDSAASAGQLIRFGFVNEINAADPTTPSGWTQLGRVSASNHTLTIYEKIATGGETSVTVSQGSNAWAYIVDRFAPSVGGTAGTGVTATTANPNPPAVTPAGGSKPYLAAAYESHAGSLSVTTYPSGYSSGQNVNATGTNLFGLSRALKQVQAATEDPGTFTISASAISCAQTVMAAAS